MKECFERMEAKLVQFITLGSLYDKLLAKRTWVQINNMSRGGGQHVLITLGVVRTPGKLISPPTHNAIVRNR
jgi:hypothetical protein